MSFKFTSNNANSSCVPMMTIGSNQNSNIIGYVCKNKNIEHFSEPSNYNVSAFPGHSYASVEPFGNSNVEHFAGTFSGNEGQTGTVDCDGINSLVVESVDIDYFNKLYRSGYKLVMPGTHTSRKKIPCKNEPSCSITVNNALMGDPSPGQGKQFKMAANCVLRSQAR